jgi:hypothetical protein
MENDVHGDQNNTLIYFSMIVLILKILLRIYLVFIIMYLLFL